MDHELKQRLIGAVVVTALAAIFIPMLFDDPVDTSGKTVTELAIPQAPSDSASETAQNLPDNKEDVLGKADTELSVSEDEGSEQTTIPGAEQENNNPVTDQANPPMETGSENAITKPIDDATVKEPEQNSAPELDTGVVEKQDNSENDKAIVSKPIIPVKKPKPAVVATVKKPVVAEKTKLKSVPAVEKTKSTAKSEQDKSKKATTKLVRYTIQAGSFSKKENAQALVDKLRKQGLPATLSTKGSLFRVKIGPELDKKKAADIKAKLDKQNIGSLVTSE